MSSIDALLAKFPPIVYGVPSGTSDPNQFDWFGYVYYIHREIVSVRAMVAMAVLYYPVVLLLQKVMESRKALDLQRPLFYWNLLLCSFSGYAGFHVIFGMLLPAVTSAGFTGSVCSKSTYTRPEAFWVIVFNYTKLFEWIDTLFLLLRKKNIGFLHWFHHAVTMLYCLHASHFSALGDGSGTWFCGMNLFIHFLMYGYWAALSFPFMAWLRKVGFIITILQTAQMFTGLAVLISAYTQCPDAWQFNWHGTLFAFGMYAVYFYLFFKLVMKKVTGTGSGGGKKQQGGVSKRKKSKKL